MESWFERTDLNLLLHLEELTEKRLVNALGALKSFDAPTLQRSIFENTKKWLRLKTRGVVYDVTNTYFHGRRCSLGRLGHDKANLLGSLLTTQFQLAAMARTNQPEHERRDFYLFIDEFQNFSTDAFTSILAEARKYRLCLTLSHQYIDQLSLPVRQAVRSPSPTPVS